MVEATEQEKAIEQVKCEKKRISVEKIIQQLFENNKISAEAWVRSMIECTFNECVRLTHVESLALLKEEIIIAFVRFLKEQCIPKDEYAQCMMIDRCAKAFLEK